MKEITSICTPCEPPKVEFNIQEIIDNELCRISEVIKKQPLIQTKVVTSYDTEYDCLPNMAMSMVTDKFCRVAPSCRTKE